MLKVLLLHAGIVLLTVPICGIHILMADESFLFQLRAIAENHQCFLNGLDFTHGDYFPLYLQLYLYYLFIIL